MNFHENVKTNYRRNLPHIQPIGGLFFVTYRLKDTLPKAIAEQFKWEKQARYRQIRAAGEDGRELFEQQVYNEQKRQFAKYDNYLDRCICGERWLQRPEIASLTANTLHFWADTLYELIVYTVMPNHVHVVMDLSIQETQAEAIAPTDFDREDDSVEYRQLFQVMKSVKNFSALTSNEVLNRKGSFWQKESYDHLVRDGQELSGIIRYVLENPVKAGLCSRWEEWPFTYLNPMYSQF
ncbi:MAG: hypothetical protein LH606_21480 [Cytophagaceae bacterium]|nr:hypothetical protein [Cytophagaceae bacterium]